MKFNRIYINNHLAENIKLELGSDHTHYIKTVLRLKVNDQFRILMARMESFLHRLLN